MHARVVRAYNIHAWQHVLAVRPPPNSSAAGCTQVAITYRIMRYSHSLISALLCLTLLFFASADLNVGNEEIEQLVRPSRTSPITLAPRGADLTAAQRLARGLPLNVRSEDDPGRHRERDIRSGGTARYTGTSRGHFDRNVALCRRSDGQLKSSNALQQQETPKHSTLLCRKRPPPRAALSSVMGLVSAGRPLSRASCLTPIRSSSRPSSSGHLSSRASCVR